LKQAVFLDRDGVINEAVVRAGKPHPPAGLADLKILPEVPDALQKIRRAGFLALVVTNQPDVARGSVTRETVESMHAKLGEELPLDGFYTCWHDDADSCDCRKPKPGLLQQAARDHGLDLTHCFLVGDRWKDVEAGRSVGCRTAFLDRGYLEKKPASVDFVCDNLSEATDWILKQKEKP